MIIYAMQEET